MSSSSVGALSRRLGDSAASAQSEPGGLGAAAASPAAVLTGPYSFGTMLGAWGVLATPSAVAPLPKLVKSIAAWPHSISLVSERASVSLKAHTVYAICLYVDGPMYTWPSVSYRETHAGGIQGIHGSMDFVGCADALAVSRSYCTD